MKQQPGLPVRSYSLLQTNTETNTLSLQNKPSVDQTAESHKLVFIKTKLRIEKLTSLRWKKLIYLAS